MSQNLSSAAVVNGALRIKMAILVYTSIELYPELHVMPLLGAAYAWNKVAMLLCGILYPSLMVLISL